MSHSGPALSRPRAWILAAVLATGGATGFALGRAQDDAGFARIRELSPDASQARFEYEVMRAEIRKPVAVLLGQYRNRLEGLEEEFQAQGDLDSVLSLRAELDSLEKNGEPLAEPPAGEPLELVEAREIFLSNHQPLEAEIASDLEEERQICAAELGKVVEAFVKEGEETKAVQVQSMIDALDEEGHASGEESASGMANANGDLDLGGLREIEMRVQVDGVSHLMLRGDEIWFDHSEGRAAAPGRHFGEFPTYLGGEDFEWMPEWEGDVTRPLDGNFGLPTDEPAPTVSIRNLRGRGYAEVVEQPSAANGYTARIAMRDETRSGRTFAGSEWIEFRIVW